MARRIAQLVADAGAHIAQVFGLRGFVARPQTLIDGAAQIHLAHIHRRALGPFTTRHVLDIDDAQPGELQAQFLVAIGQVGAAANGAFYFKGLGGCRHGHGLQLDAGAAVVKAGLVNVDALEAGRMVHLNTRFLFLTCGLVMDDDVAGKQLGHARRVILDDEFFQLNDKGQFLQQDAVGLVKDGGARRGVFGHQQIGAKRRVALGQAVLRGHIGDQAAAVVDFLAAKPHLGAHRQVAIEQAPHTHQHDGRVRRDVAHFVGRTRLGRQHPALARWGVALLQLDLPASRGQQGPQSLGRRLGLLVQMAFGLVMKSLEALLADVFLVVLQVHQDLGRVAGNAQAGAEHQESQNQQEPPGAVNTVELEGGKQLGPKRPELVDVVVGRLVLLEHRADHRGDANDRQQGNGKPHRRQQLDHGLPSGRAALGFRAGCNSRHGVFKKEASIEMAGQGPPETFKAGKPALVCFISADS